MMDWRNVMFFCLLISRHLVLPQFSLQVTLLKIGAYFFYCFTTVCLYDLVEKNKHLSAFSHPYDQ